MVELFTKPDHPPLISKQPKGGGIEFIDHDGVGDVDLQSVVVFPFQEFPEKVVGA
jgi:hypothetical protein